MSGWRRCRRRATTPAAPLKASVVGGRPPVEAPSPPETSSPLASSASTRWAIVERARPVSAARSPRVVAWPLRTSSRIVPAAVPRAPVRRDGWLGPCARRAVNQRDLPTVKVHEVADFSLISRQLSIDSRQKSADDRAHGGRPGAARRRCAARRHRRRRVHRRRPRPRRACGPGPASSASPRRRPSARSRRPHGSEPSVAFRDGDELIASGDIDVVHVCTPNDLHRPLADAALAGGKHVVCEKPLAVERGRRPSAVRCRRRGGLVADRAVRLPLLPDGPRGARARRRAGRPRPAHARQLPAGLAVDRAGRQLAGRRQPRRAVAGLRRHRLALVRPGRVRHRRSHRLGVRRARHRAARAPVGGRALHAFEQRRRRDGRRVGRHRGRRARACSAPRGAWPGRWSSARSRPVTRTSCASRSPAADATLAFDQEQPDLLWIGRRGPSEVARPRRRAPRIRRRPPT